MAQELVAMLPTALGVIELPTFLEAPTGRFILDCMPCVSLVICLPTIRLYAQRRRYLSLAWSAIAFFLAAAFHVCHMHTEGIVQAKLLGLSGPAWRTLDIIAAQTLLARTVSHAIGSEGGHPMVGFIPNVLLPVAHAVHLLTERHLRMQRVMNTSMAFTLLTVAAKLVLDGPKTMPSYSPATLWKIWSSVVLGFTCFFMPNLHPAYWLWHSLWHVFMGIAFLELYKHLDGEERRSSQLQRGEQQARAKSA